MAAIDGGDSLKYALTVLPWILVVGRLGSIPAAIGFVIAGGNGLLGNLIGVALVLVGAAIVGAGTLGLLYKTIADGMTASGDLSAE